MVEYRPECGIWCKGNNNHLRLKRQRLMKLFLWRLYSMWLYSIFNSMWCMFDSCEHLNEPCLHHGIISPYSSTVHSSLDNQTTSDCRRLLTSHRRNLLEGQQRPTVGRWLSIQYTTFLFYLTVREQARQVYCSPSTIPYILNIVIWIVICTGLLYFFVTNSKWQIPSILV